VRDILPGQAILPCISLTSSLCALFHWCSSADAVDRHPEEATSPPQPEAGSPLAPSTRAAGRGRSARAAIAGTKRKAAEAALPAQLEAPAEQELPEASPTAATTAQPVRRSSRREAAAAVHQLVALEGAGSDDEDTAPSRLLPQRAAAISSPAGKRRRLSNMLEQLADVAAEQAAAEEGSNQQLPPSAGGDFDWQQMPWKLQLVALASTACCCYGIRASMCNVTSCIGSNTPFPC
jgi:hypothetical protein